MTSIWPSTLASLNDNLTLLQDTLDKLDSALPVDVAEASRRIRAAEDASRKLRTMLHDEVPEAEWNNYDELAQLVAHVDLEQQRARLRALADELQRGNIVHRRAARVAQLIELRDHAVSELHSLAEQPGGPPPLPGPDAGQWVEWACSLKEPDDAQALQNLREGFLYLDEFVASLEPGMWVTDSSAVAAPLPPTVAPVAVDDDSEERRARLVDLADELERGNIVHHRGIRVAQVNQLREMAIDELRSLAQLKGAMPLLPGPEPEQWVPWACTLKEPDDAADLLSLRNGFVHLDEFVANLEPDMWVAPRLVAPAEEPEAATEESWETPVATAAMLEEAHAPVAVEESRLREAVQTIRAAEIRREAEEQEKVEAGSGGAAWFTDLWETKRGIMVAIAAVVIVAVLGAMRWTVHRTHANNEPAKTVEASAPVPATTTTAPETKPPDQPTVTAASLKQPDPKAKTETAPAKPAEQPPAEKPAARLLEGSSALRTPESMPKNAAPPKTDDGAPPVLTAVASPAPNSVMSIVKSVPSTTPRIRASSGVAQGQLIHSVTPLYPSQARVSGIQGTVTLQAVIAKDGKVQSVKVLHGPAMLTQSAVDAVKQWQYKPFMLNGEPAEADIQISVNFTPNGATQ